MDRKKNEKSLLKFDTESTKDTKVESLEESSDGSRM